MMLIVLSGLPGVGKTAIARELARRLGAIHLRIDSVERVLRDAAPGRDLEDLGYRVAYAVAEDNLRLGLTVVADSVNPIPLTRDAWLAVAQRAGVPAIEVEIVCSDTAEHRHRVETRVSDLPGLPLPGWSDVIDREYAEWHRDRLVLDTAVRSVEQNADAIRDALPRR